jgi:hypothetical protein
VEGLDIRTFTPYFEILLNRLVSIPCCKSTSFIFFVK